METKNMICNDFRNTYKNFLFLLCGIKKTCQEIKV